MVGSKSSLYAGILIKELYFLTVLDQQSISSSVGNLKWRGSIWTSVLFRTNLVITFSFSVRTNQHRVSAWGGNVNHQGRMQKLYEWQKFNYLMLRGSMRSRISLNWNSRKKLKLTRTLIHSINTWGSLLRFQSAVEKVVVTGHSVAELVNVNHHLKVSLCSINILKSSPFSNFHTPKRIIAKIQRFSARRSKNNLISF